MENFATIFNDKMVKHTENNSSAAADELFWVCLTILPLIIVVKLSILHVFWAAGYTSVISATWIKCNIELNHKICCKSVIPRSARWRRNGVDWSSFTNEVKSKMSNLPPGPNLSLQVSRFSDILISAATTHVGKSKSSKRSKPRMTPHVRAKIRIQNRLRQTIHQNCQEWIDACREANEAINEAKTESWKNLLQTRCPIPTVQTRAKLFKVLTVLLMLILLTKLCPTMVAPSLILNPKLTSSLTTTQGTANSICHNPTVTPTDSSRSVLMYHLLTTRAVLHF